MTGYEYALKEIKRTEQFLEDEKFIFEYCNRVKKEKQLVDKMKKKEKNYGR